MCFQDTKLEKERAGQAGTGFLAKNFYQSFSGVFGNPYLEKPSLARRLKLVVESWVFL